MNVNKALCNATVLITGGTGTFGSAFLDRCLERGVAEVRIFSRDEKKQYDMAQKYHGKNVKFCIGDIRERHTLDKAMNGVDYVFHAAAMKQVPSCEQFPMEAFKTNVIGSNNVLESAIEHGVKKVICLSTDKAVNPVSTMGLTKALMEKCALQKSREQNKTEICITRFCNLMVSNGSVVPLFMRQAMNHRSLTITDPEMTRYMMSMADAIDVVEKALCIGCNGEIFIRKARACKIGDLAKAVYKTLGMPEDSPVEIIGTRPGERKHESLLADHEVFNAIEYGEYIVVNPDFGFDYPVPMFWSADDANRMGVNEISLMIGRECIR